MTLDDSGLEFDTDDASSELHRPLDSNYLQGDDQNTTLDKTEEEDEDLYIPPTNMEGKRGLLPSQMTKEQLLAEGYDIDERLEGDATHVGQMDLRVAKIDLILQHDSDDTMYIEEVDLGAYDDTRLLATTLSDRYKDMKELQDRKVIIACNLEPLDRREIMSSTAKMLIAYKKQFNAEGEYLGSFIEVLDAPSDSEPGAKVYVEGYADEPFPPDSPEEVYDFVMREFSVNAAGQVFYNDKPLKVEGSTGKVTASSISDGLVRLD